MATQKPSKKPAAKSSKPRKGAAAESDAPGAPQEPPNPNAWHSKIVGHDRVPPAELIANPLNYRTHPEEQLASLRAGIKEGGFVRSVTANKRTGTLIDGHARLQLALESNQEFIDVEWVDLTDAEEKLILASLDKIGELAEADPEILDQLLRELNTGSEELARLFAEMADDAGLTPDEPEEVDTGPQLTGMSFKVIIDCESEEHQSELLQRFNEEGMTCRALIT